MSKGTASERLKRRAIASVFPLLARGLLQAEQRPLEAVSSAATRFLLRLLFALHADSRELLRSNDLRDLLDAIAAHAGRTARDTIQRLQRSHSTETAELHARLDLGEVGEPRIPDSFLAVAIFQLGWDWETDSQRPTRLDYRTLPIRLLGSIYEQLLGSTLHVDAEGAVKLRRNREGRRVRGTYFTPDAIVTDLVAQAVGPALEDKLRELRHADITAEGLLDLHVLDPAMGSGLFLVEAARLLSERLARFLSERPDAPVCRTLEQLRQSVVAGAAVAGVVLCPDQVSDAILLKRLVHERCLCGVDLDPLAVELAKMSLWLDGGIPSLPPCFFDHHLLCGDALLSVRWESAFADVFSRSNGAAGFDAVLGNPPYLRMERLKPIRPLLKTHYACHADRADAFVYFLERAVTLLRPGGHAAFITSSTWTRTRAGEPLRRFLEQHTTLVCYRDLSAESVFAGAQTYPCLLGLRRRLDVRRETVNGASWLLDDAPVARLRQKIRAAGQRLVDLYGSPRYGIKTGLNTAFVLDRPTRDALLAKDPGSDDLLRPFLEGKDVKAWRTRPRDLWLIWTPRGVDLSRYPAIRAHLEQFRERLERRATKQRWYELQQPQQRYVPLFQRPKLVYPRFVDRPLFALDRSGAFVNNALSILPVEDPVLLVCLMSPITWLFLAAGGAPMANGYRQIHGHVLEQVPLPRLTEADRTRLAAWFRDAEAAGHFLDPPWRLLYEAFDLTAAEIRVLEHLGEGVAPRRESLREMAHQTAQVEERRDLTTGASRLE